MPDFRDWQLVRRARRTGRPWRARWSWRCCWHPLLENLGQKMVHELALGGDPLADKVIDLSHRGWPSVELLLARRRLRLRLQALPVFKRVLGFFWRDSELRINRV